MICERSVITGCTPIISAVSYGNGVAPYSMIPGRTMSPPTSREANDAGRIGNRARIRKSLARRVERGDLLLEAVLLVGAREMRHEAQRRDRIAMREALHQRRHLGGAHAQAVHSGVDLQEHLDRPLEMRLFEHRHLIGMMNDRREAPGREFGQLVGGEKPFEQQDPPRVVRSAQLEGGVELDDRKAIRVRERREYAHEAVAVGVGLDHREHLRLRRARRGPARDLRAARRC